jgi:hypothetical protein
MRPHHFVGIEAGWASTANAALGSLPGLAGRLCPAWWLLFSRPGCGRPWLSADLADCWVRAGRAADRRLSCPPGL